VSRRVAHGYVPTLIVAFSLLAACSRSRRGEQEAPAAGTGNLDSASGAGSAAPVVLEPLCDGSDRIRLELSVGHGRFQVPGASFTGPLGARFVFVDGQCRYFAGSSPLQGIRTGVLDEPDARALAEAVGFGRLATWEQETAGQSLLSCLDGPAMVILGPIAGVACVCSCGDAAPEGLDPAISAAGEWLMRLFAEGMPSTGPVRVAAESESTSAGWAEWAFSAWPMAWPVTDVLVTRTLGQIAEDAGKRVEDESEAAQLRALRAEALARAPLVPDIFIRESAAAWYRVYVRDELPDDFMAAVRAFRSER